MKTMADITWDNSIHFLAEATDKLGKPVVMLAEDTPDDFCTPTILCYKPTAKRSSHYIKEALTPTGRKYLLDEALLVKRPMTGP